jgi:DNA-binding winged helix-turn-helix (wHTH) protein/TolB-like protein/tetratricopeptide (TPR) repeat protein
VRQERRFLDFGPFRVDTAKGVLLRAGQPVALSPKAFDTLLRLLEEPGQVVTKAELMESVWPDAIVEENNLTQSVSALRKALGDANGEPQIVLTVPKRGYRFVAEVRAASPEEAGSPAAPSRLSAARAVGWLVASSLTVLAVFFVQKMIRGRPPLVSSPRSIAVLPFRSLQAGSADEILELGMADAVITRLSRLHEVVVRPTSAIRRYTGLEQDSIAAGRELRVEAVLEGTIQKADDRYRFTVRLVNVADGKSVWSGAFDELAADLFTIEDSIAGQVAVSLSLSLSEEEHQRLRRPSTRDPRAYDTYLKGRYEWNKRTSDGLKRSVEHFRRALDLDPDNALAYAGLADSYVVLYDWQYLPPDETVPLARAAATKALELDGALAEAHASLAEVRFLYDHDWSGAESEFRTAIRLSPNYATAHHWYARLLQSLSRFDEALVELKKARDLDPLSPVIRTNVGALSYYRRRYDDAIEQLRAVLVTEPDFALAHWHLANAYERKGMFDLAIEEERKGMAAGGAADLAAALERARTLPYRDAVYRMLDVSKANEASAISIARRYACIGDSEQAFVWLEKAWKEHSPWLVYLSVDPQFDSLREDPRFVGMLKRVGFPSTEHAR